MSATNTAEYSSDIEFLTVNDVITIHSAVIDAITPGEPKDILDHGRLEAATFAPQQTFDGMYLYPSIHDMAAVYLHGLASGHAFQQGNKRVAFLACYVFLQRNGLELTLTNQQAIDLTLAVVTHDIDREEVARLLETHTETI